MTSIYLGLSLGTVFGWFLGVAFADGKHREIEARQADYLRALTHHLESDHETYRLAEAPGRLYTPSEN